MQQSFKKGISKKRGYIHSQIQLELRHSTTSVKFLDVRVGLIGDTLSTDVYTKPTDTKAYLHHSSDHPSLTKRAIPSSLTMRAKGFVAQTRILNTSPKKCETIFSEGDIQKTRLERA